MKLDALTHTHTAHTHRTPNTERRAQNLIKTKCTCPKFFHYLSDYITSYFVSHRHRLRVHFFVDVFFCCFAVLTQSPDIQTFYFSFVSLFFPYRTESDASIFSMWPASIAIESIDGRYTRTHTECSKKHTFDLVYFRRLDSHCWCWCCCWCCCCGSISHQVSRRMATSAGVPNVIRRRDDDAGEAKTSTTSQKHIRFCSETAFAHTECDSQLWCDLMIIL